MKALVLSGGGSKGAYQVGALRRWMKEEGHDYDAICGISVGAINGAYLAQFPMGQASAAATALEQLWSRVTNETIKRSWFPFGILESIFMKSVFDSRPLQSWIRQELRTDKIHASRRKLRIVAVSWNTGESRVKTEQDEDLAEWVIASSAFPVMLSPVEIGGDLWTDGGLRSVTPLGAAIDLGADEIHVIMTSDPYAPSPFDPRTKTAIPGFALRALDILTDQITRADLEICGLKNDLAMPGGRFRRIKLRLLQPATPLTNDPLDFDPAGIKRMMDAGYREASAAAEAISAEEVRGFVKRRGTRPSGTAPRVVS